MCLALPARIVELQEDDMAIVELGGIRKDVSLGLVEDAKEGEYVIVHVGYALSKLDADEAQKTLNMFAELGENLEEHAREQFGLEEGAAQ